jgi:hypothetical protein
MKLRQCWGLIIVHSSALSKSQYFIKRGRKGQSVGAVALRQLQWKHAKRPDASGVAMTIHMPKHRLGEHDKALHLSLTAEQVDEVTARLEKERGRVNGAERCGVKKVEVQAFTSRPAEC